MPVLIAAIIAAAVCTPLIWLCEASRTRCGHCGEKH